MSIDQTTVIDAVAIDRERNVLFLLLTDPLPWKDRPDCREYDYLMLLQEKINAYLSYLETTQYQRQYPDQTFDLTVIEIRFQYDITDNFQKFLNTIRHQVEPGSS